jgi:RNA polymerase sigma-70 factor (ECF subfamily)
MSLSVPDNSGVAAFESHRAYLTGLAYRMLGSFAEAQDAVQDAYLRWHRADRGAVANTQAYLTRVISRLCLDRLKSAQAQRETYVGPWLPEPVLGVENFTAEAASEYADDLSTAFLLALERLTPLERVVFILHDVFDLEFGEIASLTSRSEVACRQLASRARRHVRDARPRSTVSRDVEERLLTAFLAASKTGDPANLAELLAEDAALYSDGGGKASAARNVLHGRERVSRFITGIFRKFRNSNSASVTLARINGMPGVITRYRDGSLDTTTLEIRGEEVINVFVTRNPDKLRHLERYRHINNKLGHRA